MQVNLVSWMFKLNIFLSFLTWGRVQENQTPAQEAGPLAEKCWQEGEVKYFSNICWDNMWTIPCPLEVTDISITEGPNNRLYKTSCKKIVYIFI